MRAKREIDMLSGSMWDKILLFALPLALTGILQQLFNAADVIVVGRFTGSMGAAYMAAVGANSPVIGLIVNLFIGVSLGTNIVVANAVGAGDHGAIGKAVHTSVLFALICGAAMAVLGEILSKPIIDLLGVPGDVYRPALLYLRIYLAGLPVILLYNYEAAVYRGVGNTRTPLLALTISGILNVLLNLFFVVVVGMNADGVAIATVISNAVSSLYLTIDMMRSRSDIHLRLKDLKIDRAVFRHIMRIGIPTGIQSAVFSISNIIIQYAINSLGTIVMAASSASYNVEIFAYEIFNSFSQACATFTSQNNGAGRIKRCRKALFVCIAEDTAATAVAIVLILFFGRRILSVFTSDNEVIETGYQRLVVVFAAYFSSMLYEVMSGYMRGFGISAMPAFLTTLGICGVRIAWIYLIFPRDPTFRNIIMVYPYSLTITMLLILASLLIIRPAKRIGQSGRA